MKINLNPLISDGRFSTLTGKTEHLHIVGTTHIATRLEIKLAKWIFRNAGILGLLVSVPMLFVENAIEQIMPPSINHPEFFYGFVLLNICWQILYLFLASDPVRYRPLMIPSFLAKGTGVAALTWLSLQGRISSQWMTAALLDGVFAILFLVAYWVVGRKSNRRTQ